MKAGRYQEAAAHFKQAINLDKSQYMACGNLGAALLLDGEYNQALDVLQKLTRRYPRYKRGQALMRAALKAKYEHDQQDQREIDG